MTNIIDIARLIDPAAWAEADEYAAMTSVAPEGMKIFFDQRVMRIVTPSIEAAQRVVIGLQSMASADPEPTAPSSPTLKKSGPRKKSRTIQ